MSKRDKFLLAVGLQVVIIAAVAAFKLLVMAFGTEIMLTIMPVDPRDVIRGDYLTFRYNIGSVNSSAVANGLFANGETVYVSLHNNSGVWMAGQVSSERPADGQVFIKGRVVSGGLDKGYPAYNQVPGTYQTLNIAYGIEDYFVPEGKGQTGTNPGRAMTAKVAVDSNGDAVLKQVYVDGKPWP